MKNIILIGFAACGKTTVGEELAKQINYTFVDAGKDENLIKNTLQKQLIAIDQSVLSNENLVHTLKYNSIFIYLQTNINTILRNNEKMRNDYENMGHFLKTMYYAKMQRLLIDANLIFEQYADYTIDVREDPVNLIVNHLYKWLYKKFIIR